MTRRGHSGSPPITLPYFQKVCRLSYLLFTCECIYILDFVWEGNHVIFIFLRFISQHCGANFHPFSWDQGTHHCTMTCFAWLLVCVGPLQLAPLMTESLSGGHLPSSPVLSLF